jgi:hypothetical protein
MIFSVLSFAASCRRRGMIIISNTIAASHTSSPPDPLDFLQREICQKIDETRKFII